MKRLLVGVVAALILGCASNSQSIQPQGMSVIELGVKFPDINALISGKKSFQDMSTEAQKAYMYHQKEIVILKMLESSNKFSADQILAFWKMRTSAEVVTAVKTDPLITQTEKDKIISDISKISPSVPKDIDIVELPDNNKGKQVAGKLSWVKESGQWIKQVVLYNDAPMPDINHPVWNYTSSLVPPNRPGSRPWEPYAYKLFN